MKFFQPILAATLTLVALTMFASPSKDKAVDNTPNPWEQQEQSPRLVSITTPSETIQQLPEVCDPNDPNSACAQQQAATAVQMDGQCNCPPEIAQQRQMRVLGTYSVPSTSYGYGSSGSTSYSYQSGCGGSSMQTQSYGCSGSNYSSMSTASAQPLFSRAGTRARGFLSAVRPRSIVARIRSR